LRVSRLWLRDQALTFLFLFYFNKATELGKTQQMCATLLLFSNKAYLFNINAKTYTYRIYKVNRNYSIIKLSVFQHYDGNIDVCKLNYHQALICILSSSNGGKTYQRQISGG